MRPFRTRLSAHRTTARRACPLPPGGAASFLRQWRSSTCSTSPALRTTHIVLGFAAVQADFLAAMVGKLDYLSASIRRHPSRHRFEILWEIELNHSCYNSPPLCDFLTRSFVPGAVVRMC